MRYLIFHCLCGCFTEYARMRNVLQGGYCRLCKRFRDGVRVVLDLASTEKNPDYVAVSSTTQVGDTTQPGMYTFINVTWRDEENPGQITDEEKITISVDDPVYTGDKSLERTIVSGQGVSFMGPDNLIECTE